MLAAEALSIKARPRDEPLSGFIHGDAKSSPPPPIMDDVAALLERLAPARTSRETAARFLSGQKGNMAKAHKLCAAFLKWRSAEKIDGILEEPPLEPASVERGLAALYAPLVLDGCDRKGRPVLFAHFGRLDIRAFARAGVTVPMVLRRHVRETERLARLLDARAARGSSSGVGDGDDGDDGDGDGAKNSRNSDGFGRREACIGGGHLLVLDVQGLGFSRVLGLWKLWQSLAFVSSNYYPDLLGCCCIVRPPAGAKRMLDMVKTKLLDPATGAKIQLAGQDPLPMLQSLLPLDVLRQLPPELVGSMSDEAARQGISSSSRSPSSASPDREALFRESIISDDGPGDEAPRRTV